MLNVGRETAKIEPASTASMQKIDGVLRNLRRTSRTSVMQTSGTTINKTVKQAHMDSSSWTATRQAGRQADRVGGTGRQRREARDMETY